MDSSHFASGEELFNAKSRNQVLPSWGAKESEVCGSWFEERQVETRLQDRQDLIREIRLVRKDQLAAGRWIKESKMVQLTQQTGTFWEYMGVETDIGRCLYPEEAIYLIEMCELEVTNGDLPLSIQSAQAVMLLDHYHLDQFHVYAHLARTGCKVVRHQPHLRFTKYEKQIRLDQHQAKKKKRKLKLKEASSKLQETSNTNVKKVVQNPLPNMDDAIKDFYSFLGDDVAGPETDKNEPEVLEVSQTTFFNAERRREDDVVEVPSKTLNNYERKKRELIDMFPSMLGSEFQIIHAEPSRLCPQNSEPQKEVYRVSLEILSYYSKYIDDGQQNYQGGWGQQASNWNRGRGNFRGRQNNGGYGSRGPNSRQGSYHDNRNWHSGRNKDSYDGSRSGASNAKTYGENDQNYSTKHGSFDSRRGKEPSSPRMGMAPGRSCEDRIQEGISNIRNDGNYRGNGCRRGNEDRFENHSNSVAERRTDHENWHEFRNENETRPCDVYAPERVPAKDDWGGDDRRTFENQRCDDRGHSEFRQMTNRRMGEGSFEDSNSNRQNTRGGEMYDARSGDRKEDIYARGNMRRIDGDWRNMRRENESGWRDDNEHERKMARLGTDDRWESNERLHGGGQERNERLHGGGQERNERLHGGGQERNERLHGGGQDDRRHFEHRQNEYEGSEPKWQRNDGDAWGMNRSHPMQMENQMQRQEDRRLPGDRWGDDRRFTERRQMQSEDSEASWKRSDVNSQGMDRYSEIQRDNYMQRHDGRMGDGDNRRDNGHDRHRIRSGWNDDRGDRDHSWHSSDTFGKSTPHWHQHDDRWSSPNAHDESTRPRQMREEPLVDLTIRPQWKTKKRKVKWRETFDTYPSYLVKLPVQVNSWKEYKGIVNSMTEDNVLNQGLGQALWRGPSTPLIKPVMATTLQNVLDKCSFPTDKNDTQPDSRLPEFPLTLHFDVYPPNMTYKKTNPSIPGKRITVVRDGAVPSLSQIQEVTKRFPDEAPVVCAVVTAGEVRLYTLCPISLPSPKTT